MGRAAGRTLAVLAIAALGLGLSPIRQGGGWQLSVPLARANGLSYAYDSVGRVIQATDNTAGTAVLYTYDASGNITSQSVVALTALSIAGFSPAQGPAGTQVTVSGTGFSTTASANVVSFNGTSAAVTSSTTTQLIVTVPSGATSGAISVGSVTSAQPFTVTATGTGAPTIAGFTPAGGPAGTTVTITGTGFSPSAGGNKVLFNGVVAQVTSATSTSLTAIVPPDSASGPIQVVTSRGSSTSTTNFVLPPSGYTLADVVATGQATENGGSLVLNESVASKPVIAFFKGTQGDQYVKVAVQNAAGTAQVIDPHGTVIATWSPPGAFYLPTLKLTGTYSVTVISGSVTGVAVTVTTPLVRVANLSWSSESEQTPDSIAPGPTQRAFLTFGGAAGQLTEVDIKSLSGVSWTASLLNSAGTVLWTSASFSSATTLLAAGASGGWQLHPGFRSGSQRRVDCIHRGNRCAGQSDQRVDRNSEWRRTE